ncbi:MAG: TIGR04282 family arsenosugar biosynthesis glycosyltransferase [Candidatus Binatia bacterium]
MPIRVNALAVMAKAPVAGTVKTRLVPPLTPEQAAEFYRALLLDQFDHLINFAGADRYVFYVPADAEMILRDLGGADYAYLAQRGDDLGTRMAQVFADLWHLGHRNIVLIGSDLPALPLAILDEAFTQLARAARRAVFGPSRDGGYYLVGMNDPTPEIFENMTWSHGSVLAQTLAKLKALNVEVYQLPPWFDVDTRADLTALGRLDPAARARIKLTLTFLRRLGEF